MTREEAIVFSVRCFENRDFYPYVTSHGDGEYTLSVDINGGSQLLSIRTSGNIQPVTPQEIAEAFAIVAGSKVHDG